MKHILKLNTYQALAKNKKGGKVTVNIPSIISIDIALKIYYENFEIVNKEITALFGQRSSATISRLKKIAKAEMDKRGILTYGANKVNTEVAFIVWGIDVADLEKRITKIQELSLSI